MSSSPAWSQIALLKSVVAKETGTILKPWGGRLPFALVYPNKYYAGMSNLGFQTIYQLLNSHSQVVCERVFAEPGGQMDADGRGEWITADEVERRTTAGPRHLPLLSLESQRPLDDFPIVAFSVSYELDYLNVVQALQRSDLPLLSADRDDHDPIVLAGGPCLSANPEPLAPFIDCIAIGEGEVIVPELVRVLSELQGASREAILRAMADVPGLYVPLYPRSVRRQSLADLNSCQTTSVVLTPQTELGDMYMLEIARGCARGCRFCLAGYSFAPMRWRSVEGLIDTAQAGLSFRKRIGLVGAAVSDHPQIDELIRRLRAMDAEVAVSSIRAERLSETLVQALVESGVHTLTIAPEAATPRLRRVIAKGLRDEQIERAVDIAGSKGVRRLKLYFMIGLPSESDDDAQAIVDLSLRLQERLHRYARAGEVVVNMTPFVPKAATPFQWSAMEQCEILEQRLASIRRGLSSHRIRSRAESPAWSIIQGLLARGDARVGAMLPHVRKNSIAAWTRSIREAELDMVEYLHRERDLDEVLPWSRIDPALRPELLRRERLAASELAGCGPECEG